MSLTSLLITVRYFQSTNFNVLVFQACVNVVKNFTLVLFTVLSPETIENFATLLPVTASNCQ